MLSAWVLDRHDPAAMVIRAIAANDWPAWTRAREVVPRRGGDGFALLDLAVEVGQQEKLRRGLPGTWPASGVRE